MRDKNRDKKSADDKSLSRAWAQFWSLLGLWQVFCLQGRSSGLLNLWRTVLGKKKYDRKLLVLCDLNWLKIGMPTCINSSLLKISLGYETMWYFVFILIVSIFSKLCVFLWYICLYSLWEENLLHFFEWSLALTRISHPHSCCDFTFCIYPPLCLHICCSLSVKCLSLPPVFQMLTSFWASWDVTLPLGPSSNLPACCSTSHLRHPSTLGLYHSPSRVLHICMHIFMCMKYPRVLLLVPIDDAILDDEHLLSSLDIASHFYLVSLDPGAQRFCL